MLDADGPSKYPFSEHKWKSVMHGPPSPCTWCSRSLMERKEVCVEGKYKVDHVCSVVSAVMGYPECNTHQFRPLATIGSSGLDGTQRE